MGGVAVESTLCWMTGELDMKISNIYMTTDIAGAVGEKVSS